LGQIVPELEPKIFRGWSRSQKNLDAWDWGRNPKFWVPAPHHEVNHTFLLALFHLPARRCDCMCACVSVGIDNFNTWTTR